MGMRYLGLISKKKKKISFIILRELLSITS